MTNLIPKLSDMHGTTVLGVQRDGKIALAADGQVTLGATVMKHHAKKIRKIYKDQVLVGFAGATADAITLFEKFEGKLEHFHGNLLRSAVELSKDWRTDKILRRLEALLIAADSKSLLIISGSGDVIEAEDGVCAIGSGGPYAAAAARALLFHSQLGAKDIAQNALKIAGDICIYTNQNIVCEEV